MSDKKVCSMNEVKPIRKHTFYEHGFRCACSLCNYEIDASADFTKDGKLIKVCYPINYCPNCGAEIEKFTQYGE